MSIEASTILDRLLGGGNLAESEAGEVIQLLTDEALPQAMSAALLIALRQKGETAEEVRGFAKAMRLPKRCANWRRRPGCQAVLLRQTWSARVVINPEA
jgi:anthranilate phosphoribosyltransferase